MFKRVTIKMVFLLLPAVILSNLLFCTRVLAENNRVPVVSGDAEVSEESTLLNDVRIQIDTGAKPAYGNAPADPRSILAGAVKIFLGITGTICFVLIVMSGYWYITSHGDSEKVEQAQVTVRNAVLGLIVVLAAYGITILIAAKVPKLLTHQKTAQEQNVDDYVKNGFWKTMCGSFCK